MSDWKPFVARLSLFAGGKSQPFPSPLDLFASAWSQQPDNFQKAGNPLLPGVAQGQKGTLFLSCVVRQRRLDFEITSAPPSEPATQTPLPSIEDSSAVRAELDNLISFVSTAGSKTLIGRVALYAQFGLGPGKTTLEVNRVLTSVIPLQYRPDLREEEDFILQLNSPHDLQCDSQRLRLNCITKWSVEAYQLMTFAVPAGGMLVPAQPITTPQEASAYVANTVRAVTISFDMNNVPVDSLTTKAQHGLLIESMNRIQSGIKDCGFSVEGF